MMSPRRHVHLGDQDWLPMADFIRAHEARADAGDPKAAAALGLRLGACHRVLRDYAPERLLQEYEDEIAYSTRGDDTSINEVRRTNIENRFLQRADQYDDCSVLTAHHLARAAHWLEQAARAGDVNAQLRFADLGLAEFDSRERVVRDPREAHRRRALARSWLQERIQAGDEHALRAKVQALDGRGLLFERSDRELRIHEYALQLAVAERMARSAQPAGVAELVEAQRPGRRAGQQNEFARLWEHGPGRYPSDAFQAAEWAEIEEAGRQIYTNYFAGAEGR